MKKFPQKLNQKLNKRTFCNTHTSLEDGRTDSGRLFEKKNNVYPNSNCFLCTLVVSDTHMYSYRWYNHKDINFYVLYYNTASNAHFIVIYYNVLYIVINCGGRFAFIYF